MAKSFREIGPGVLSTGAMIESECATILAAAQDGPWTQAEITNYDDKGMLAQYVDLKARNVQVKGPASIPHLCDRYVSLLDSVARPLIQEYWGITGLRISGPQLAKYVPGSHIRAHNDTATEFSARCVSALLYLNDDYAGGELVFPRLGLSHTARTGDLLLFPSEYLHAVYPVISGVRYCFVGFFLSDSFGNWEQKIAARI
ncbi:TPA: 2OG-Fe(II) oxygenase [Klebsiella quasipneumoniae subsp. similipneumoniae]|nr:2OG-Fe(II) oxygenase [Klebsiella quasipneumoniae subsp. similipneumoniae]